MKGKLVGGALLLALVVGCLKSPPVVSEHERKVLEMANRHAEQQSVQSRQMADLQKQWQTERTDLNAQRNRLGAERQLIALQRQREPLIAESIKQVGILALCLLPLIVCALLLLLRKSNEPDDGNAIAETLVSDLMSARPTLFVPALPAPSPNDKPAGHLTSAAE